MGGGGERIPKQILSRSSASSAGNFVFLSKVNKVLRPKEFTDVKQVKKASKKSS